MGFLMGMIGFFVLLDAFDKMQKQGHDVLPATWAEFGIGVVLVLICAIGYLLGRED